MAALWLSWLGVVCVALLFAVAVPWLARIAICLVLVISNVRSVGVCVLLRGTRAVRALEWQEQGDFTLVSGTPRLFSPAALAAGCFRLGSIVVLRLSTAAGMRVVLIDGGLQEMRAFRRLCRRLAWRGSRGSGVPSA